MTPAQATTIASPPPTRSRAFLFSRRALTHGMLPGTVFLISTLLFMGRFLVRPTVQRSMDDSVTQRHVKRIGPKHNDTRGFLNKMEQAGARMKNGQRFYEVSTYDVPVTYLAVAGAGRRFLNAHPLALHNTFFCFAFLLNGITAYLFLRCLSHSVFLCIMGGLLYQTSNFAFCQHLLGHAHLVQMQYVPLAFLFLIQVLKKGRSAFYTVALGITMGLQVLSSPSYTLFLALVALPVFAVAYWRSFRGRDLARPIRTVLIHLCIAVTVTLLVSGFYLIDRLSVAPRHFPIAIAQWRPFNLDNPLELLEPSHPTLFIGFPLFIAGTLAVRWAFSNRGGPWIAIAVTGLVCLVMMLPPIPLTPYWIFYRIAPLAEHLRVPERFFPLFHLMLIGLAVGYLSAEREKLSRRGKLILGVAIVLSVAVFNWLSSPWPFGLTQEEIVESVKRILR